jgi:hypothetical protein
MIDFLGALWRGDFEAAAGLLDPEVSWQGLREEWVCHGREEWTPVPAVLSPEYSLALRA